MTITIRLKTGNAAFADDKYVEIKRILREWNENGHLASTPVSLRDYNGNTVGSVTITGK